jgi:hypothetical protein
MSAKDRAAEDQDLAQDVVAADKHAPAWIEG